MMKNAKLSNLKIWQLLTRTKTKLKKEAERKEKEKNYQI